MMKTLTLKVRTEEDTRKWKDLTYLLMDQKKKDIVKAATLPKATYQFQ